MGDVGKGIEAGFIATIFLTFLLFVLRAGGAAPDFDLIALLTKAAGVPDKGIAWMLMFTIGVVLWGGGFAVLSPHLPGPHWVRGLIFGLIAWLGMMIAFLPAAGMRIFAIGQGLSIPTVGFAIHLIYGFVLGETYHLLLRYLPSEVDENS